MEIETARELLLKRILIKPTKNTNSIWEVRITEISRSEKYCNCGTEPFSNWLAIEDIVLLEALDYSGTGSTTNSEGK